MNTFSAPSERNDLIVLAFTTKDLINNKKCVVGIVDHGRSIPEEQKPQPSPSKQAEHVGQLSQLLLPLLLLAAAAGE